MFGFIVSNRVKGVTLTFLLLFVLIFSGCISVVSPTFSHQGRLLNSSGNPVADGTYTIVYKLYHASSGGTPLYTSSASVAVTDGYFNSSFGGSDADPKIFSEQTWLEITINGETLSPRQLLRGAPYASGLVAGSAAIGPEPITYTYGAYDNLGSAFFVANTDSSATGGSGLTAVTTAQFPFGSNQLDVAAVRGLAVNSDSSLTTGTYAGIFVSEDFSGLYAKGHSSLYSAYLDGNIYVSGNCFGCAMALVGQNTGEQAIEPGDFVTALGVEVDPEYEIPILLLRKAGTGDTILGVAESAMNRGTYYEDTFAQIGYEKVSGAADPNSYLSVISEGLVQARIPQELNLEIGAFVTIDGTEIQIAQNRSDSTAQVMSTADETGLQWILLSR